MTHLNYQKIKTNFIYMKFKHSKEFAIGLSVVIALAVLFFGIEYLKGNNIFKPANYYVTSYTNVAGLAQSAPVTLNGFKVGLVREIEYDYAHPGQVNVELSLDKELRLPEGSVAILATDMLGTSSVELILGKSDKFIEVGQKVPGKQAEGLMSKVTDDILPAVGEIMPKVDSLLTALNDIASNPAINSSLNHINTAMSNIETSSKQLSTAMNSMPGIAGDAKVTMANVRKMSENLTTIANDLTTLASQLKDMPIDQTMENVYQTSQTLKELMNQINDKKSSLGMLLNDPKLYNNLSNASASLDSLLIDVKKNPKRYISIKLF